MTATLLFRHSGSPSSVEDVANLNLHAKSEAALYSDLCDNREVSSGDLLHVTQTCCELEQKLYGAEEKEAEHQQKTVSLTTRSALQASQLTEINLRTSPGLDITCRKAVRLCIASSNGVSGPRTQFFCHRYLQGAPDMRNRQGCQQRLNGMNLDG